MKSCSFILGSGESLLNLKTKEKALLNAHPHTLAMNKYLLFYEKIGVLPKDFFLADCQFPAHLVANRSLKIVSKLKNNLRFYLHTYYQDFFGPPDLINHYTLKTFPSILFFKNGLLKRLKVLKNHHYWIDLKPYRTQIKYFDCDFSSTVLNWSESLDQTLYFYRGSLTTSINLANIIYPETDICLLGVDLNSKNSFYESEIAKLPEFEKHADPRHAERMKMSLRSGKHATILTYNGAPGIQSVMPDIVKILKRRGLNLFCANPNSYLVKEGICSYRSISSCLKEN
jgi:hypothetical protein